MPRLLAHLDNGDIEGVERFHACSVLIRIGRWRPKDAKRLPIQAPFSLCLPIRANCEPSPTHSRCNTSSPPDPRPALVDRRAAVPFHRHQFHRPANAERAGAHPSGGIPLDQHGFCHHPDCLSHCLHLDAGRRRTADRSAGRAPRPLAHRDLLFLCRQPHRIGTRARELPLLSLSARRGGRPQLAGRHQGRLGVVPG